MAVRKDVVDNDSKCQQTPRHRFAICPIDGLLGVFTEEIKSLLTDQLVRDSLYPAFLHRLAKGLMDNLVAGVPGDVAVGSCWPVPTCRSVPFGQSAASSSPKARSTAAKSAGTPFSTRLIAATRAVIVARSERSGMQFGVHPSASHTQPT